ncbi:MAG: hypothetical protein CBC04_00075 [Verrucomicrobia bacterium TMED44]|nr:MAG: hypothetical protein CBC04_00075 [Verrucomicrobia bacterium TMED44]
MQIDGGKVDSLHWAIEELSKQRQELDGKIKIARKREETGSLIEEVHAQKDALEKRISALEDGLKVSSELVDTPLDKLEEEISSVNDKLEIAQERLESLEQEQYLEDLGRKLNRSHDDDASSLDNSSSNFTDPASPIISLNMPSGEESNLEENLSTTTQTMSTPSNRIETSQESTSRISETVQPEQTEALSKEQIVPLPVEGLEETATKLGVEPDFLVEKGTQALLRMIARNGGQLKFPLEIDQID